MKHRTRVPFLILLLLVLALAGCTLPENEAEDVPLAAEEGISDAAPQTEAEEEADLDAATEPEEPDESEEVAALEAEGVEVEDDLWLRYGMVDANGVLVGAARLLAYEVADAALDDTGAIEDFVVDLTDGRVVYALLRWGDLLGVGGETIPMPLAALTWQDNDDNLSLAIDETLLDGVPDVDGAWPTEGDEDRNVEVFAYWDELGLRPYPDPEQYAAERNVRLSDLMDLETTDVGSGPATVADAVLDLSQSQVKYLLLAFGEEAGEASELIFVPFGAFDLAAVDGELRFVPEVTGEVLAAAPRIAAGAYADTLTLAPTADNEIMAFWQEALEGR